MKRYTALYWLTITDSNGQEIQRRSFIGTSKEAYEEWKAEYEHWFPDDKGKSARTDKFWRDAQTQLSLGVPRKCRITGYDSVPGKSMSFVMEQIGPMKEESAD